MRFPRLSRVFAAALAASVLSSGVALADSISVDGSATGDVASPPSGVWAPGDCRLPFTTDGVITVSYDNAGGQGHYLAGEQLSISAVVTHGQTVTTSITSTLKMPNQPPMVPGGWGSDVESFTVPITTTVAGSLAHNAYQVSYTVSGGTSHFSATDQYIVHVCDGTTPPPPPPPPPPPGDPCAGAVAPAVPTFTETGGTLGDNGWWKAAPTVSASSPDGDVNYATDADGPYGDSVPALNEGPTTIYARATNSCDLASTSHKTYYVDRIAPGITSTVVPASPDGTNGWYVTGPTITFNCSDATSGIASSDGCVVDGKGSSSVTLGESKDGQTVTGTAKDNAGWTNSNSAGTFYVDLSDPVLNISGPVSGGSSICDGLPARPSYAASDAISGLASSSDSWATPSAASGVGTYVYTAHAQDNAGRKTDGTRTYTVNYGAAVGTVPFLQPINTDGSSRFKLGSTIPVKFQALCGTTPLANVVARMYVVKNDGTADPGTDEAISTSAATTGNLFRYDATGQQYIFNLSTKLGYTNPGSSTPISFTAGSWTLKILLDDGSWRSVNIQIVK